MTFIISTIVDVKKPTISVLCLNDFYNFYYCRLDEFDHTIFCLNDFYNFYYCRYPVLPAEQVFV